MVIVVLEALPEKGVVKTLLNIFMKRCITNNNNPKVVVGRLIDSLQYLIPRIIENAKSYLGKDYDYEFDFENDKIYCSELIYFAFQNKNSVSFFDGEVTPMTFFNSDTKKFNQYWVDYFQKLGKKIPEGKLGINPGGILKSKLLQIVHSFF